MLLSINKQSGTEWKIHGLLLAILARFLHEQLLVPLWPPGLTCYLYVPPGPTCYLYVPVVPLGKLHGSKGFADNRHPEHPFCHAVFLTCLAAACVFVIYFIVRGEGCSEFTLSLIV